MGTSCIYVLFMYIVLIYLSEGFPSLTVERKKATKKKAILEA